MDGAPGSSVGGSLGTFGSCYPTQRDNCGRFGWDTRCPSLASRSLRLRHSLAGAAPEVDAYVLRVLLDLGELVAGELQLVECI